MSGEFSHLQQASQKDFDAAGFFHSNLQIQEAVSTVRYGIEARKGLIVITSEAGLGKTTLLHKVTQELAANVTWMIESDSRLSFVDVIRRIARNLDVEVQGEDEVAMLRACKLHLRERLENCEIVAFFVDNAHDLPDQTLRRITQNFLGASAEDPDGSLLQLVLAGRPALKLKLSEAALVPLRRKPPIFCEIHPIESREIGSYVHQWLERHDQSADVFDARAMKRVALYTRGNLRDVNVLCERALQLAGSANSAIVTAELIDHAANNLHLRESQSISEPRSSRDFETTQPRSNRDFETAQRPKRLEKPDQVQHAREFQFFSGEYAEPSDPAFPPSGEAQFRGTSSWRKRTTALLQALTVLTIFVAAAATVRMDSALDILAGWNGALQRLSAPPSELPPQFNKEPETPPARIVNKEPLVPVPGPDRPAVADYEERPSIPPPSISDPRSDELSSGRMQKSLPEPRGTPTPKNGSQPHEDRRTPLRANANLNSQDLQVQITRAIENRAIMGVEVSVVQGTAYLDGHVATERQRRAAERAARSVSGVERVHNRIAITFG